MIPSLGGAACGHRGSLAWQDPGHYMSPPRVTMTSWLADANTTWTLKRLTGWFAW